MKIVRGPWWGTTHKQWTQPKSDPRRTNFRPTVTVIVTSGYVTEDTMNFYVTEDGSNIYVPE